MRSATWLMVLVTLALLGPAAPAWACKCAAPTVQRSYDGAEVALKVLVLGEVPVSPRAGVRRYIAATLDDAYKGCVRRRSLVLIETNSEPAACGTTLAPGSQQLLFAGSRGSRFGLPLLTTGSCSGNREWDGLTEDELHYLATRNNCCGGVCECVDSEQVACLVDPCAGRSCSVPGAVCEANYCGGCAAEWHLPDGSTTTTCDARPERPAPVAPCRHAGCNGELCVSPGQEPSLSVCVVRPEFSCLVWTTCEPQSDGQCGFTASAEYEACLAEVKQTP
jgi:hypothetical protein